MSNYQNDPSTTPPSTAATPQAPYAPTNLGPSYGTAGAGPAGGGGLLGPVFSGLGAVGLDPGQGNQQLAAGLNNLASQAQGSAIGQLGYMSGALGSSEGYYNPAQGQYNQLFSPGGSMTAPGSGEQAYGAVGSSVMDPSAIGNYQQGTAGQFAQPGAMEQFAQQTLSGQNPYYQMLSQQGGAAVDQSFNAGGNYGSGARLAAQAKYQGDLSAQTFNNEASIMNNAQGAQNQRLATGGQLASSATSASQNAYNDYLNQALAAQAAGQGRQTAGFQAAQGLGDSQAQLAAGMYTNADKAYADILGGAYGAEAQGLSAQAQASKDRQAGLMGVLGSL